MSWWQFWQPGVVAADEAWVVQKLNQAAHGVQLAVADLNTALEWTFNHFDTIAADVTKLIGLATVVGLNTNPTVVAAETAANAVLAAIASAKAHAAAGNTSNIQAAAQSAYEAVKNLQVAHAAAAVTVASNGTASVAGA